jgi:hypothetical protein
MYTGSLGAVANQEDWIVTISLLDDTNTAMSVAGAAISLFVTEEDRPSNSIVSGSVADGTIVISADGLSFTWTVSAATLAGKLPSGTYAVFVRMLLNGVTSQLISGTVSIVEGGPAS